MLAVIDDVVEWLRERARSGARAGPARAAGRPPGVGRRPRQRGDRAARAAGHGRRRAALTADLLGDRAAGAGRREGARARRRQPALPRAPGRDAARRRDRLGRGRPGAAHDRCPARRPAGPPAGRRAGGARRRLGDGPGVLPRGGRRARRARPGRHAPLRPHAQGSRPPDGVRRARPGGARVHPPARPRVGVLRPAEGEPRGPPRAVRPVGRQDRRGPGLRRHGGSTPGGRVPRQGGPRPARRQGSTARCRGLRTPARRRSRAGRRRRQHGRCAAGAGGPLARRRVARGVGSADGAGAPPSPAHAGHRRGDPAGRGRPGGRPGSG